MLVRVFSSVVSISLFCTTSLLACFLGALQLVAGKLGKGDSAKDAVVHTSVHIGEPKEMPGFGLAVDIKVEGVDEDVIKGAHEVRFSQGLIRNCG
jgi:organic hydroperoxide reductase OsmC/OhrA